MPPTASKMISAVNHPLRRQILLAYVDGSIACASAEEVAGVVDHRVGRVAYHLKTLARSDILRPVRDAGGRGAKGLQYRWALGVEPEWLGLLLAISEGSR